MQSVGADCLLPQHLLGVVNYCLVMQWHGVGVVSKGRGGIPMPETCCDPSDMPRRDVGVTTDAYPWMTVITVLFPVRL